MKGSMVLTPTLVLAAVTFDAVPPRALRAPLSQVATNDNRVAAGTMKDGMLEVHLDTREGAWHPYGPSGPTAVIQAFGEAGKPLQTPGPMIRVQAGTRIHARVTNSTSGTLVVHGLADRASRDDGHPRRASRRDARGHLHAADAGTFFYWGTTTGVGFDESHVRGRAAQRRADRRSASGARQARPHLRRPVARAAEDGPDSSAELANGFFTFNGRAVALHRTPGRTPGRFGAMALHQHHGRRASPAPARVLLPRHRPRRLQRDTSTGRRRSGWR